MTNFEKEKPRLESHNVSVFDIPKDIFEKIKGYVKNKDDPYILNPVEKELDKLEIARIYIKQYSQYYLLYQLKKKNYF